MKAAVVYYSLGGNTEYTAKIIAEKLNADLIKLKPKRDFKSPKNFTTFFFGGMSAVFNMKPQLMNPKINLDSYDAIVIGSPIWASRLSSPINTFLKYNKLHNKTLCMFACHAGGGAEKAFELVKGKLNGVTVKATAAFKTPLTDIGEAAKILAFCEAIKK